MGAICSAVEAAKIDLSIAALKADMLAFNTCIYASMGFYEIKRPAVFVAANGELAFSAPFDLERDFGEIEKHVADKHLTLLALSKCPQPDLRRIYNASQNPETYLCLTVSALLRQHGSPGTDHRQRLEYAASLFAAASVLGAPIAEHRACFWHQARQVCESGHVPVLAFLVSDPSIRPGWFKPRPNPHFEAVIPFPNFRDGPLP